MKRSWGMVAVVCLLGLAAAGGLNYTRGCSSASAPPRVRGQSLPVTSSNGVRQFEVTWAKGALEATAMYFPAELDVLEVVPSEPTKQKSADFATRLGVAVSAEDLAAMPQNPTAGEDCYAWQFGPVVVEVYRDGNLWADWPDRDPVREHFSHAEAASALNADEAAAAADKLVRDANLLPEGCRVTEVSPKLAVTRYDQASKQDRSTILALSVTYRRFHGGFPEGSLSVTVNGKGEIVGLNKNMRDVRSLGKYPLLTVEEARGRIWSTGARVTTGSNAPGHSPVRAEIEKVRLEYYDGATAWRYDTIQPIYVFTGTGWNSQGRPQEFSAMVPAVRPEFLEFVE